MIVYEALVVPFLVVFDAEDDEKTARWSLAGVYACELLFCVDVYVQLNMGYYEDGNMLRDSRMSRMKYIKSPAFALDLLALPPLSLFMHGAPHKSVAVFEMHKLIRVWRLPGLISDLDNIYARHFALLKLAKVLGLTLALSHLVACGRHSFGTGSNHEDPWLLQVHEGEGHDRSTLTKYLSALFWAFGLLTGLFEGELPQNSPAFAFTILVAFGGFTLFTYLCATFFLLSKCESGDSETSEARVNQLKHLLAFHRVPEELKTRAVEYLKRYHTQSEVNDRQAAKLLCPSISSDIQIELLRDVVARIPVFAGCDVRFINAVTSLLELVSYPAHYTLFRAGDRGDAMYVVHSGVLHTVVDGVKVRELRKGSCFGEVAVFARLPRSAAMVSTTYCTLYRLSLFHADKLLDGYPRYAKQIAETVQTIIGVKKSEDEKNKTQSGATQDRRSSSATGSSMGRGRARLVLSFPQLVRLKHAVKSMAKKKAVARAKKAGVGVEPSYEELPSPVESGPTIMSSPEAAKPNDLTAFEAAAESAESTELTSKEQVVSPSTSDEVHVKYIPTQKIGPQENHLLLSGPMMQPLEQNPSPRHEQHLANMLPAHSLSSSSKSSKLRLVASDSRDSENRGASHVSRAKSRRLSLKVFPSSPHIIAPQFQSQRHLQERNRPLESSQRASFILQGISALQYVRASFFGGYDRVAPNVGPDAIRGFYDNIQGTGVFPEEAHWWSRLLLRRCLDNNSRARITWILILQLVCIYDWILVPLELSFSLSDTSHARVIDVLNALLDMLLWADFYVNMNLSFSINAEKILDTTRSAERYLRSWAFVFDLLTAWPYWIFIPSRFTTYSGGVLRIPRLVRVWRTSGYFVEANEYFHFNSKQRLLLFGLLLVILYHIVACLFFSITFTEGYSENERAWIPSTDVMLHRINASYYSDHAGNLIAVDSAEFGKIRATQYFRALYYAANVLAALGLTIEPESDIQYAAALGFMLSGFVITAIVVDEVQKKFTASAFEQKEFFAARSRIQLFLKRQNAPLVIHQRVNAFLDYWWSAHRGAIIDNLLMELPRSIKRDIVRSICLPVMETLALMFELTGETAPSDNEFAATSRVDSKEQRVRSSSISRAGSLGQTGDESSSSVKKNLSPRSQVENIVLDNLKFVLYGQNEVIYRPGDYAAGLFFLLEGQVSLLVDGEGPRKVPIGGFFGSAALKACDNSAGNDRSFGSYGVSSASYSEYVTAVSGCIVIFLSCEHLTGMARCMPLLPGALWQLEMQLRHVTVTRTTELKLMRPGTIRFASCQPPPLRRMRRDGSLLKSIVRLTQRYATWSETMTFDPDAAAVRGWDTVVFALSAIQSARVWLNLCMGVPSTSAALHNSDAVTIAFELLFLLDMYIQSHLGFYEFGNKIMDRDAIRRHYFMSKSFVVDVAALLPLFVINIALQHRFEVLNLNKMLRALKFPRQLNSLSTRFVKLMMEIRLLKLAIYTFFATHILGCIWFDFAANNSGFHSVIHASLAKHGEGAGRLLEGTGHESSSTETLGFGGNEWLPPASLEHASRLQQYLSSLFWAFGLMSASSPGELPKTASQSIFSVITMTVGFFLFAYVVGNFSDIIELEDSENKQFLAQVSSLRKLLYHFKLPIGVEEKFKKYFLFKRFHSITQEHVLERVLPPSLLVDIRLFQLQPMIVKVAFLAGMDDSVTRMLVSLFTQVLYVKDEYVCRFGEDGSEMFFIFTGVLDIYIPLQVDIIVLSNREPSVNGIKKVNTITAGSYFGEAALFTKAPRNAYVKASTSCILYQLSRHSLELVFDRFPDWKQKVLRIVKIQQQQLRLTRLAKEAQDSPDGEPVKKGRGLRRTFSRMDVLNTRAEGIEDTLLGRKSTTSIHAPIWNTIAKHRASISSFVSKSSTPVISKMRRVRTLILRGTDIQSKYYLIWLRLVILCTIFMAISLPYRIAYDTLDRSTGIPLLVRIFESISEVVYWLDIWFLFHVRESHEAMELYEQDHLQAYKRDRMLVDLSAAFPLDHFFAGFVAAALNHPSSQVRRWLRLNRCLKMVNFVYYRNEVTRRSVAYELNRVVTLWLQYLLVIYWTSCAYFAVSMHEGFGQNWQAWRPPVVLDLPVDPPPELLLLRLFRGFFYATTAFVKKGKTFVPTAELDTSFSIIVSFVGQLVMALMISEMANIFLLYIDNEVQFRKNHITVELFLVRSKVSSGLNLRAHSFLSSWWSSHAGIDYQLIFNELPQSVRTEGIAFIAEKPLAKFTERVFRPLLPRYADASAISLDAVESTIPRLARSIAQRLRFVGYPRDENVIVEGSICRAMYFVVKGFLLSKSISNPTLYHGGRFRSGDYFGDIGLLGHSVSLFTVTTIQACDLFVLEAQDLEEILQAHSYFNIALQVASIIINRKMSLMELFSETHAPNSEISNRVTSIRSHHSTDDHETLSPRINGTLKRSEGAQTLLPVEEAIVSQLKGLIGSQSHELTWRAGFNQFSELIRARGSIDVDSHELGRSQSAAAKTDGELKENTCGRMRSGVLSSSKWVTITRK